MNAPPIRHLYVHIPFCHRICPYCSFYKHKPGEGGLSTTGFPEALLLETRQMVAQWGSRIQLETIYWGGGTPTLLSASVLECFLPQWLDLLGNPNPTEWTVEMNPLTLTTAKLQHLRAAGVNRASLGVQSWDPQVLQTLGRDHSPQDAREAYQLLREAAFPIVSLDHMFSVPGQSLQSWEDTLAQSIALQPDHISCYNLTYEEDTAFFESLMAGDLDVNIGRDADHFGSAMEKLANAGFQHYETSNYARPGFESLHNSRYWQGADYLGLGPSAVSTVDRIRWKNKPDTAAWRLLAGHPTALRTEEEHLTEADWKCERIALQLRTREGFAKSILSPYGLAQLEILIQEGLAQCPAEHVQAIGRGKYLVDSLAEFLVE